MSKFKISKGTRCELSKFKEYMRKQEYTNSSVIGYCTHLSRFLRQAGSIQASTLKESIETFLNIESMDRPKTFKYCRAALRLYYRMVVGGSLNGNSKTNSVTETAVLLQLFRNYSLEVKHIQESTVVSEIRHVREFLEYTFEHNSQGYENELTAEDIRNYIVKQLGQLSDSSKGRIITSIRNFFRCQEFYGHSVHQSVFRLPLSPAVWKKSAFPTTMNINIFNALYMIPNENTDAGKRNRCIILFFTELALRCSEVAALTLDDFNWHNGCVTVRKAKNGAERALPLSMKMTSTLVEYLTDARPQTSNRMLFVRFSHKRGEPMGRSQIRGVIRRNGAKAGLEDKFCGTHILRRTVATKLYNSGNSLKLTADILGHESIDSTTHYSKADLSGLLSAASPWPGGERNVR
ncbi:MAG: tyrosine-type recombinase/integrase [Smithellaceae bacterium]|nr:tyrosine-type recombinase/integrase [Smithellaceae bacterium]